MPLSYRIIKNHQVDEGIEDYEIPVVSIEHLVNGEKEPLKVHREKEQVRKLIKSAQDKAKGILQEAQIGAEQIKNEAHDQGYQEGFAQGVEEGELKAFEKVNEEVTALKEQAKELLGQAHKKSRDYIRMTREEIVELSVAMAKSIIHYNINVRDENMVEMINNALKQAEGKKQIIIRSSPQYNLLLETNLYQFKRICPNATFTIMEDKSIEDQSCIIETEDQVLNLSIDLQLENIREALLEMESEQENEFSL